MTVKQHTLLLMNDPFLSQPSEDSSCPLLALSPTSVEDFVVEQFENDWESTTSDSDNCDLWRDLELPAHKPKFFTGSEMNFSELSESMLSDILGINSMDGIFHNLGNEGVTNTNEVPSSPSNGLPAEESSMMYTESVDAANIDYMDKPHQYDQESLDGDKLCHPVGLKTTNTNHLPKYSIPLNQIDGAMPNNAGPLPSMNSTIDNVYGDTQINMTAMTPTGRRRKDLLASRNYPDSPVAQAQEDFQDVKPEIKEEAAGTRKRNFSSASTVSCNKNGKKMKMYEDPDINNVQVKNAKAARLNREKKKKEQEEMKAKIAQLTEELERKTKESEEKDKLVDYWQQKSNAERRNAIVVSGIAGTVLTAKELLEHIIPILNNAYGPMNVQVAESYNQPIIINDTGAVVSPIAPPVDGMSPEELEAASYTTLHISPTTNNVIVDYNPRKLI